LFGACAWFASWIAGVEVSLNPLFSEAEAFNLLLNKERFNVAHRVQAEPKPVAEPTVITRTVMKPCQRTHLTSKTQEARDQVMFNAGRAAAGATDAVAVEAHNKLMELLSEEAD